jgi:hypothetical protein
MVATAANANAAKSPRKSAASMKANAPGGKKTAQPGSKKNNKRKSAPPEEEEAKALGGVSTKSLWGQNPMIMILLSSSLLPACQ